MRSFKDSAGRTWDVLIDPWRMKLVTARTGVRLQALLDDNFALWTELNRDPVKFVEVLFALCSDQVEKRKLTEEDFFVGLTGDELRGAYDAFREAFEDFSPSHLRKVLRATSTKAKVAQERATERALAAIEAIDPDKPDGPSTSSTSASGPPESPASAPSG